MIHMRPSLLVPALVLALVSAGSQTIPEARCTSLAGTTVNLPEDLHGRTAVLVLGFNRDSQEAVTGWGRRLAADYRDSSTVVYYEMAMLGAVPRIMRGMVLRSMRKDVSERAQARFLPVTENETDWRNIAHYDRPRDAYILLVASDGTVQWQTAGPPTDAAYAELKKHLP